MAAPDPLPEDPASATDGAGPWAAEPEPEPSYPPRPIARGRGVGSRPPSGFLSRRLLAAVVVAVLVVVASAVVLSLQPSGSNPLAPAALTVAIDKSAGEGPRPLSVQFGAALHGGKAPFTYSWEFGDGATSTDAAPLHVFGTRGTFSTTVAVSDATHVTISSSTSIVADPTLTVSALGVWPDAQVISGAGGAWVVPFLVPTVGPSASSGQVINVSIAGHYQVTSCTGPGGCPTSDLSAYVWVLTPSSWDALATGGSALTITCAVDSYGNCHMVQSASLQASLSSYSGQTVDLVLWHSHDPMTVDLTCSIYLYQVG